MATVTRENAGHLTDKITVHITKDDYFPSFEKAIKQYSKNMNLPGFRKGMVPTAVVKKKFGPGIYAEEVLKLMEKEVNAYLGEQQDGLLGQPIADEANNATINALDMNSPQDYKFSFEIGLRPTLQIADLASATLDRKVIAVTPEMVDEEIDRLRTRLGEMTKPETVADEDHVLNLDIEEVDTEGNAVADGLSKKGDSLLVKYFAEATRKVWMDKKIGDSLTISLKDGFEEKERQWLIDDLKAGTDDLEKPLKFTITGIGKVNKRDIDEAFLKEALPGRNLESEQALRDAIKEDIGNQLANQTRGQVQDAIYHYLIDNTSVEFPEAFLKKWIMQGDGKQTKTEEQAAAELPSFLKSLKWQMISDALMQQEGVNVSPEELKAYARVQMMGYMGITEGQAEGYEWLDSYVDRMMQDRKYMDRTYNELVTNKLFAALEQKVGGFKDEEVTIEQFNKAMEGHHHHH